MFELTYRRETGVVEREWWKEWCMEKTLGFKRAYHVLGTERKQREMDGGRERGQGQIR